MRFRGPVGPKRQLTRPRGLPNYAEVVQDIAYCGLGCGLEKVHRLGSSPTFPEPRFWTTSCLLTIRGRDIVPSKKMGTTRRHRLSRSTACVTRLDSNCVCHLN